MSKITKRHKKIEKAVVSGYKAIEDHVVGGYKRIEDGFVKMFLSGDEGDDAHVENADHRAPCKPVLMNRGDEE